jgi:hypothetical protein
MRADGELTGVSGATVQALFAQRSEDEVVLDLVALGDFEWCMTPVPAGTPFTMSLRVPEDVAGGIMLILGRWVDRGEILGLDVGTQGAAEIVLLEGPYDQLFLEFFHPLPEGQ